MNLDLYIPKYGLALVTTYSAHALLVIGGPFTTVRAPSQQYLTMIRLHSPLTNFVVTSAHLYYECQFWVFRREVSSWGDVDGQPHVWY
jgi:hypothetical protein